MYKNTNMHKSNTNNSNNNKSNTNKNKTSSSSSNANNSLTAFTTSAQSAEARLKGFPVIRKAFLPFPE